MTEWKKLAPIKGGIKGCLCCGVLADRASMDDRICVGFGYAALERDGKPVWSEAPDAEWEDCLTVDAAEKMASVDPDHDWRIVIHGPLSGRTYQRHTATEWVLVEKNGGFA